VALRRRQRQRLAKKVQKVLPDVRILGVGVGTAGPDPRLLLWAFLGGYLAITLLVSLALRTFVAPGGLLSLAVFFAVSRPRYVVLTDRGVAVLKRGILRGTPKDVTARVDAGILERASAVSHERRQLDLGSERVWIKDSEVRALRVGLP